LSSLFQYFLFLKTADVLSGCREQSKDKAKMDEKAEFMSYK
tara:strand:+ start:41 stop:163 length:123 start_codon:yes stop_codon:yes gene_type:complete